MRLIYSSTLISLFTFFCSLSQAQTFEGRLYIQTAIIDYTKPLEFGYIEYPEAEYYFVDSLFVKDFMIKDQMINIAGKDLIRMDADNHNVLYSASNQYGKALDFWGEKIAVVSDSIPYLRVYNSDLTLDFAIDTPLIPYSANDILIEGDKAYLTLYDGVKIIDLVNQDTIPNQNQGMPSFLNGFYRELFRADSTIYTKFEWYTAAPWVTFWQIDVAADSLIQASEMTFGSGYLDVVPAGKGVYIGSGLNYYDFEGDTLITANYNYQDAVAFDDSTGIVFAVGKPDPQKEIYAFYQLKDSILIDSVILPYHIKRARLYEEDVTNQISQRSWKVDLNLSPNPSAGPVTVSWDPELNKSVSLSIYNIKGQLILRKQIGANQSEYTFDTQTWPKGYYAVEITSQAGRGRLKMLLE